MRIPRKMPAAPFRSKAEVLAFADSLSEADAEDWLEVIEEMGIEYRQRIASGETIRAALLGGFITVDERGDLTIERLQ